MLGIDAGVKALTKRTSKPQIAMFTIRRDCQDFFDQQLDRDLIAQRKQLLLAKPWAHRPFRASFWKDFLAYLFWVGSVSLIHAIANWGHQY